MTATVLNTETLETTTYTDVTAVQALMLEYYSLNASEDEHRDVQDMVINGRPCLILAKLLGADTSVKGNASLGNLVASSISLQS